MDAATRQLFAHQLAHWARTAIRSGHSPFRKIETEPLILTAQGEEHPPLVFWVNRESCMAGGLIYFPGPDLEPDLACGDRCARALGLGHFVTWGARDLLIWEIAEPGPRRQRQLALPGDAAASPTAQHDLLLRVLDELKLLAVLGSVAPQQLDPAYLANLCFGALEAALPALTEAFRLARGENLVAKLAPPAQEQAWGKGALVLTRLLALLVHDRLPLSLQPEGLERAMHFALDGLPSQLAEVLRPAEEEIPLPVEGTIRFHHLFRRLNQLRPASDRQRAGQALAILARHLAPTLGSHPLPFDAPQPAAALLLVHAAPPLGETPLGFCASAPWLALQVLQRVLGQQPPIPWVQSDLFALPADCAPVLVAGTLSERQAAVPQRRQWMTTQLRNAWPHRRFALNAACPVWFWDCLHLLGLCAPGGQLELRLPADWLGSDPGLALYELLCEQFTLDRLNEEEAWVRLRILKLSDPDHPAALSGPAGARTLPWEELRQRHRSYLRLALVLPDPIWQLLQQGLLRSPQDWPQPGQPDQGLVRYSRSTLARQLWAALSGGLPLPAAAHLPAALVRFGLPIPGPEVLTALLRLPAAGPEAIPTQQDLDRELSLWLGPDLQFRSPALPTRRRTAPVHTPAAREQLAEQILATACSDGIPQFPEHYLYDYYRPALQTYPVAAPLHNLGEFFGRYTLQDAAGQRLEVEGSETLQALLLSSSIGAVTVALPVDRDLTKRIVERYCQDLRSLRQTLVRQAHRLASDATLADQLVEQLWRTLPVPAWNLVEA